ncbi:ATP-grasp domain-containing protein [Parerythrobacter lacustris]|uniref:ATP-grasp domain-containing protein n=1 Tax=Parerythrobacter lacustris TaxID=2969984 RepID=A0ABT1XP07_9SPHN|nr:ATP-grasp domain-containing protein [Parerythrobacter lacustris]MCR2832957.1 ATP-grasp domain-containing protein [Parerythrobacter lacustris]
MSQSVVIVEPYSSGALLAERFRRLGYQCIALHLRPLSGTLSASFRSNDFVRSITYTGRPEELLRELGEFELAAIVPGQEAGVDLANAMSAQLGLAHNDPAMAFARRDKYNMHQAINAAGLRNIDQIKASDFSEVERWLTARSSWPVVIKPVLSGGTDGVRICDNVTQARDAFESEIGKVNLLGFRNEEMLAQELVEGVEYAIDTVSGGGRHKVVSVARYAKERGVNGGPIYRSMCFIPPQEWCEFADLIEYSFGVLDALGVKVGPSHTEVFVDDAGPVLVESGARLCGAMVPRYVDAISTVSPLDLAIASYVDPVRFASMCSLECRYTDHLEVVMLKNFQSGTVKSVPGKAALETLGTVRDVFWYASPGGQVKPTNDLLSSLGLVFLTGPADLVASDMTNIREMEAAGSLIAID